MCDLELNKHIVLILTKYKVALKKLLRNTFVD